MQLPNNPDFYAKVVISVVVVIGVILVQTTTGNVPDWLSTAFIAVVTFILGLTTQARKA
jgi:uncharacterized protein (DUF983 family)